MRAWRIPLLLWVIALASTAQARQFAVIADTGNATTNVASAELVKMFTAHARNWPDGRPIRIVLRDPSSADMEFAAHKLFNMSGDQARAFRSGPQRHNSGHKFG